MTTEAIEPQAFLECIRGQQQIVGEQAHLLRVFRAGNPAVSAAAFVVKSLPAMTKSFAGVSALAAPVQRSLPSAAWMRWVIRSCWGDWRRSAMRSMRNASMSLASRTSSWKQLCRVASSWIAWAVLAPIIELAQRANVSIIEASTPKRPDMIVEGRGSAN